MSGLPLLILFSNARVVSSVNSYKSLMEKSQYKKHITRQLRKCDCFIQYCFVSTIQKQFTC